MARLLLAALLVAAHAARMASAQTESVTVLRASSISEIASTFLRVRARATGGLYRQMRMRMPNC